MSGRVSLLTSLISVSELSFYRCGPVLSPLCPLGIFNERRSSKRQLTPPACQFVKSDTGKESTSIKKLSCALRWSN